MSHACPQEHKHGDTGTCYVNHKCRCADCRQGRAEYEYWRVAHKAKRVTYVNAIGTNRRLQALSAIGWSANTIAKRFGMSECAVSRWYRSTLVTPATAAKVARWYDDLCMSVPQPTTVQARYSISSTKGKARVAGWAPPLAWDDDTIDDPDASPTFDVVDRTQPGKRRGKGVPIDRYDESVIENAVAGAKPRMSTPERHEAIRRMNSWYWSARRIGEWLGCSSKTVERVRQDLGLFVPHQNEIRDAA